MAQQMAVDTADAVEVILTEGLAKAMNRFNRKVANEEEEKQ
jgi:hypothetical protein